VDAAPAAAGVSPGRWRPLGAGRVVLIDAADELTAQHAGSVVVCGDAATLRTARQLLRHAPSLVVLHDAGVGADRAGVAGLERLADVHVPAVAVAHDSARIGDADDLLERGRVAHLNADATELGLSEGPLRPQLETVVDRGGLTRTPA
jgi:hypothetical protein